MDIFDGPNTFHKDQECYASFVEKTVPHTKGFFVLAPSGAGKTHFVNHQKEKHWIDGDLLWIKARAHPDTDWWNKGLDVIKEVDARSDVVTQEAKRLGLWILGASNNWLTPDAVVLPPWDINVGYIKNRQETNYDGGLTTDHLEQLESHRKEIEEMANRREVPIFGSVDEATLYLEKLYSKTE